MTDTLSLLRTTLVGGILFLYPILVAPVLIGKAFASAYRIVASLTTFHPLASVGSQEKPKLLAIALLVGGCFFAGQIARSTLAQPCAHNLPAFGAT